MDRSPISRCNRRSPPRALARVAAASLTCVLFAGVGCDSGTDYVDVHKLDRDAALARFDGALVSDVLPDGRVIDPTGSGGGSSGGAEDGATPAEDGGPITLPDGRVIDPLADAGLDGGFVPEIDVSGCSVANAQGFEIAVPFVRDGFAITPGATDFGLAYMREGTVHHALDTALVSSSSGTPTPETVLDGYDTLRDVTLAGVADGYQLAWTDNSTDTIELHTLKLDLELKPAPSAERTPLTQNALFERKPMAIAFAGEPVVAWIGDQSGKRRILVQHIGSGQNAVEAVPEAAGREPIELAFGQVGSGSLALAWVEEVQNRGIWLQPLQGTGAPLGEPLQITGFAAPGSTVDIAPRIEDGGAVVYSVGIDQVSYEVRWHRLAADGTLRGSEVNLISAPFQAKDAGIARLGGGYVVAYRALPDGRSVSEAEVRLIFVSKDGNLSRDEQNRVQTFSVAPAARDGSQIQVEVSIDGQLLLAFVDGSDTENNTLRVIRRRLDCPL